MRVLLAVAALSLTAGCKDEGAQRHQQALEKYSACVEASAAASDPCFTEVLTILDRIPTSSPARPRADALAEGLLAARQPAVRTPLAVAGEECQRLAQQLGTTPDADRPVKLLELEACRAKAEQHDHPHAEAGTP